MTIVALGVLEVGLDITLGDNTSAAAGLLCLFPMGKGFKYVTEIGGDAIKGGSKAKNLYKAEGLLKMDLQKFGKEAGNIDKWLVGKNGVINWKSKPNFGHAFETHGEGKKNLQSLIDRAIGTGNDQGQWLDNQKVAEFLNSNGKVSKVIEIDIPEGLGRVITPTGEIISATRARIVPSKNGKIKTAFPIR
ncbi:MULTISPECIES: hypothetical protein [Clostridium]|uniref:hypothetical protein n=1 Tax=Clostridium TaxID=1485 RepID=UPI000774E097|nr:MULTISPECIES: hypothetical protein [Clostridium]AUM95024.1 hypothetical protein RSJ11_07640 [Clostridium sporogenes]AVQ52463.1 hypothetical protein C7M59_06180 [Clostridium botulinum]